MVTIEEFIEARIAEDEAIARTAGGDRWGYDPSERVANGEVYRPDSTRECTYKSGLNGKEFSSVDYAYVTCDHEGLLASVDATEATHIARHDPARVLADVAFKRNILSTHEPYSSFRTDRFNCSACSCMASSCWQSESVAFPCDELRHLAAIWSPHPDYDPSWAVGGEGSKS